MLYIESTKSFHDGCLFFFVLFGDIPCPACSAPGLYSARSREHLPNLYLTCEITCIVVRH